MFLIARFHRRVTIMLIPTARLTTRADRGRDLHGASTVHYPSADIGERHQWPPFAGTSLGAGTYTGVGFGGGCRSAGGPGGGPPGGGAGGGGR